MTTENERITKERLAAWSDRLRQDDATPVVLIGVSHGDNSGQIIVLTTEELSTDVMAGIVSFAVENVHAPEMRRSP